MRNNKQILCQLFNILLFCLILVIGNTCSQDNDEIPAEEQVKSDTLFDSIDELMKNPRWKFDYLAYDITGAQLLFQDSIATLELYQNLLQKDEFVEHLIYKYDSLPDSSYLPGFFSYPDYLEEMHFRYELLLGQEEILTKSGDEKIKLLRIVTRKFEGKYGEYIQPTYARVTGACLTSRILNNLNYQPFIDELNNNYKVKMICCLHDPIIKIFENEGDAIVFETINQFALEYLQSLE